MLTRLTTHGAPSPLLQVALNPGASNTPSLSRVIVMVLPGLRKGPGTVSPQKDSL